MGKKKKKKKIRNAERSGENVDVSSDFQADLEMISDDEQSASMGLASDGPPVATGGSAVGSIILNSSSEELEIDDDSDEVEEESSPGELELDSEDSSEELSAELDSSSGESMVMSE